MHRDTHPKISIVMPVYNAASYLRDALHSIVGQTFSDWELVAVNDGSTDSSLDILESFAKRDARIRIHTQSNSGIVDALNNGIGLARAPIIARMDADDIAMPDRLQRQWDYLNTNPECIAVGGSILKIDGDSDSLGVDSLATEHDQIEQALLHRETGLFHPTVMYRAAEVRSAGLYRKQYEWVEDHDLWLRLAERGKLANLKEVVLCYRLHSQSVCWQRTQTQRMRMNALLQEAYQARGLECPEKYLLDESHGRSSAGPGKWARMAARGYAPRTACKHLVRMWREPASLSYRLRMTMESALRIFLTAPHWLITPTPRVPRFPKS